MNPTSSPAGSGDKDALSFGALTTDSNNPIADTDKVVDSNLYRDLIQAACAAPSGDNNQPWKFRPTASGLEIYCDLERRLPSDVDGMFDMLSLGAAIENVSLKLSSSGRNAEVSIVDATSATDESLGERQRLVARITFGESTTDHIDDQLSQYIAARQTTRLPFSSKPISPTQLKEIEAVAVRGNGVRMEWMTKPARIKSLAALVVLADSLRFRYRDFHEELHRQLRLTPKHAEQSRDGLDYRTLGLPPGGRAVLRAISNWKIMSFLNRFGMARLLAAPSARLVRRSGAIGFVYLDDRSLQSLIQGGRVVQRMWLQATKLGLSVHPIGSLAIFLANSELPVELMPIGKRVRTTANELLPSPGSFLQLAFRIGTCERTQSTRSLRRSPHEVTIPSSLSADSD